MSVRACVCDGGLYLHLLTFRRARLPPFLVARFVFHPCAARGNAVTSFFSLDPPLLLLSFLLLSFTMPCCLARAGRTGALANLAQANPTSLTFLFSWICGPLPCLLCVLLCVRVWTAGGGVRLVLLFLPPSLSLYPPPRARRLPACSCRMRALFACLLCVCSFVYSRGAGVRAFAPLLRVHSAGSHRHLVAPASSSVRAIERTCETAMSRVCASTFTPHTRATQHHYKSIQQRKGDKGGARVRHWLASRLADDLQLRVPACDLASRSP